MNSTFDFDKFGPELKSRFFSSHVQNWIDSSEIRIKSSGPCLQILGLFLSETGIRASRAANWHLDKSNHWTAGAIPLTFMGEPIYFMEWQGIQNLFVPMARMDFHCAENLTYREAFSACISHAIQLLFQTRSNDLQTDWPILIMISFPERTRWQPYRADFEKLFLEIFHDSFQMILRQRNLNLMPRFMLELTALSHACSCNIMPCYYLTIHAEPDWTEIILRDKQQRLIQQRSVALAMPENQDLIKTPIQIRLNDYIHDSTEIWQEAYFTSWLDAFQKICRDFFQDLKDELKPDFISIIAPWDTSHVIGNFCLQNHWIAKNQDINYPNPDEILVLFAVNAMMDRLAKNLYDRDNKIDHKIIKPRQDPFADIFLESNLESFQKETQSKSISINPFDF